MALDTVQQAFKIFREDGPTAFGAAVWRFLYWNCGIRSVYFQILHKLNGSSKTVLIEGINVVFRTKTITEFERFHNLKGEKETIADLLLELRADDTFYDIGANVGLYSCFAGKKLPSNSVYAFEPHPANIEALEENAQKNDIQLTVCEYGLSDKAGEFVLDEQGSEAGEGKHALATGGSTGSMKIDVKTIDNISKNEIDQPTVVKIDVEGAELNVLRGGRETLSSDSCRLLYCELHPEKMGNYGTDYESAVSFIEELGFETEFLEGGPGEYAMLKATK